MKLAPNASDVGCAQGRRRAARGDSGRACADGALEDAHNVALDHSTEHRKGARVEVEVGFVVLADLGDEAAKRLELLAGARILSLRTQPLCDNLLGSLVCNL